MIPSRDDTPGRAVCGRAERRPEVLAGASAVSGSSGCAGRVRNVAVGSLGVSAVRDAVAGRARKGDDVAGWGWVGCGGDDDDDSRLLLLLFRSESSLSRSSNTVLESAILYSRFWLRWFRAMLQRTFELTCVRHDSTRVRMILQPLRRCFGNHVYSGKRRSAACSQHQQSRRRNKRTTDGCEPVDRGISWTSHSALSTIDFSVACECVEEGALSPAQHGYPTNGRKEGQSCTHHAQLVGEGVIAHQLHQRLERPGANVRLHLHNVLSRHTVSPPQFF